MVEQSIYQKLGIDPHKSSVREIFSKLVQNDYPGMFVNVISDKRHPGWVKTKHPDGDGSKFIQRILHYLETGDETVIQGAVDDVMSMNTGDVSAGGFVEEYDVTQICNVGVDDERKDLILRQIALRLIEIFDLYRQHGITINFFGGETAQLPDQVDSWVYDMDIGSSTHETNLIRGSVAVRDHIWGMASYGQAIWEKRPNSGLMSNGATMARICLMLAEYAIKYPWLCRRDKTKHFHGRYSVTDSHKLLEPLGLTVSEAIMSPTRQWALVIKLIVEKLWEQDAFHLLHGISMNTGGGATKIKHVGKGIVYVKSMPALPPFFQLIQDETGEDIQNMFTTFNCGIGIDVVGSPEGGILEKTLKMVSEETNIDLFRLGECSASKTGKNDTELSLDRNNRPI